MPHKSLSLTDQLELNYSLALNINTKQQIRTTSSATTIVIRKIQFDVSFTACKLCQTYHMLHRIK